ncbi:hypothetical protein HYS00_00560, partial [Candidatus Microgenomates bacterium]|nr:hypothetical protein [Candidatus Microgenomates bacterium]
MSKKITLVLAFVVFACASVISYSVFKNMRNGDVSSANTNPVVIDSNAPNADKEDVSGPRTEECPMNGVMYTKGQKAKWENR